VRNRVRAYRAAHEREILDDFIELLKLPNVSRDRPAVRRNAEHIVRMLGARGFAARLLEVDDGSPAVYAELGPASATRTLLLYAHYDGQPVDPKEWKGAPFQPVLRAGRDGPEVALPERGHTIDPETRIYARSASDDKAGVMGIVMALEAMKASGIAPSVRVKLFFEGEEEISSPHLRALLEKHASLLRCDGVLFVDGPAHPSGSASVALGVRGVTGVELTTYGPNRPLHSGHYGNWAPNPIAELANLVATMRRDDGTITIAGIAEKVVRPSEAERRLLARFPNADAELRRELGLAWTEGNGRPLAELILEPALNVRGFSGGHVGDAAANAIATEARASVDFRLVPKLTPAEVRARVEDHLRRQGYYVVTADPDAATRLAHPRIVKAIWEEGYPATRTPPDAPVVVSLLGALEEGGVPVAVSPSGGGSLPTFVFDEVLKAPIVFVATANHDNNQHAANENLRLQNLWNGIELYAIALARMGGSWR
jgi:acetylornithine deacetylase/succinyl-diaminopimelate desuccinylase-like protein